MPRVELLDTVGDPRGPFPPPLLPEIALAGRSNVGKSSLLNAMLGRKKLAYVSSRPGKTVTVNVFRVDAELHIADLPGFGFAKASRRERDRWARLVTGYLETRPNLVGILHLVDARHPPQPADLTMRDWLKGGGHPFLVAATKIDKVKRSRRRAHLDAIMEGLELPDRDHVMPCSAVTKEGVRELWKQIQGLAGQWDGEDMR